jgi:hypothetical protein
MDQVYNEIGAFGKYQKTMVLIIGLLSAQVAATFFSTVFTSASPSLKCTDNTNNNTTSAAYSVVFLNDSQKCHVWHESSSTSQASNRSTNNIECQFDRAYFGRTIITEWALICDKIYLTGKMNINIKLKSNH